jgi:hypothetical protein
MGQSKLIGKPTACFPHLPSPFFYEVGMARFRPVFVAIWEDDDFLDYSDFEKTLFFYLISNKNCTESGIYKISLKMISFLLNVKKEQILEAFENMGKNVLFDKESSTVFVIKFYKYNGERIGRPDLIEKSIKNDAKQYNSKLWANFALRYPKFENTIFDTENFTDPVPDPDELPF